MKQRSLRTLVLLALFIAINLILSRIFVFYLTDFARLELGNVPLLLAGLLCGPAAGAVTGAVADILGSVVLSGRGWFPLLTVGPLLMGLLPGLLRRPLLGKEPNWKRMLFLIVLTELIASVFYKTWCLSLLYGMSFPALLAVRLPVICLLTAAEVLLVYPLYSRLRKLL